MPETILEPINIILLILLLLCAFTDLSSRKIYNVITFPAIILGIGFNFIYSGLPGLKMSLMGVVGGFLILLVFYLCKGIGAGDMKLVMAIGALKGFKFLIWSIVYGSAASLIPALIIMYHHKIIKQVFSNIWLMFKSVFYSIFFRMKLVMPSGSLKLPYGFFISAGAILYWLFPF